MTSTIRATFDGDVFHPFEPVDLEPDTEVQLTIMTDASAEDNSDARATCSPQGSEQHPVSVQRLLRHAGTITSADPNSADNDRLDHDLAREFASQRESGT